MVKRTLKATETTKPARKRAAPKAGPEAATSVEPAEAAPVKPRARKPAVKRAVDAPAPTVEAPAPASKPTDSDRAAQRAEKQAARAAAAAERQAARQAERAARRAEKQAARGAQGRGAEGRGAEGRGGQAKPKTGAKSDAAVSEPDRNLVDAAAQKPAPRPAAQQDFDILIVAQGGGVDREAAILAASLRRNAPGFRGRLIVAEPQPEGAWAGTDPRMSGAARAALTQFGADIRPLVAQDFGESYPHGNKIEALGLLDPGRPFLFLDSDTLVLGEIGAVPFDFARPAASMRRTNTWPEPPAYRETYDSIWRSLYDRFGLDMDASLDLTQPEEHWERFLYFNAGWFFGADPAEFGRRFRDWAVAVRDEPCEPLACQSLDPWLDQIVLPLVVHSLGGGRPGPELDGMDGDVTCHWRNLPLLYARGPQRAIDEVEAIAALPEIAPLLDGWEPAQRLIGDGLGRRRIQPMFAHDDPAPTEQSLRHRLRQAELWLV